MKNRMNRVRVLAGGLAAIITMSSMSSIAFAAEIDQPIVEQVIETSIEETQIEETAMESQAEAPAEILTDDTMTVVVDTENVISLVKVNEDKAEVDEAETAEADVNEVESSDANETDTTEAVAEKDVVEESVAEQAIPEKKAIDPDKIYPVRDDYTFVEEKDYYEAVVKFYKNADGQTVARAYYRDGSFLERVYTPEMHMEGADKDTLEDLEF